MEENRKVELNNIEFILVVLISLFIGISMTFVYLKLDKKHSDNYIKASDSIQTIIDTYNNIKNNYYTELGEETLTDGAIKGMLEATGDPYSTFMDSTQYNNFNISLNGEYEGLGLEIANDGKDLTIVGIFADSPALEAGLKLGDILVSIDNNKFAASQDFADYVKNNSKKDFEIVINREEKEYIYNIEKRKITLKSVFSNITTGGDKKIGYIYVSTFALNTYEQFKEELEKIEKEDINSLIIDLRFNSGGELKTTEKILELFLDKTQIMYQTEDRDGKIEKVYSKGIATRNYPIVILTNSNTASASEVLAAALKDNLNATIIGEQTYGKGTMQTMLTLSDTTQYKITTKKWLTPKGEWIHGIGIKPDVEVKPDGEKDNQLETAKEYLKNN